MDTLTDKQRRFVEEYLVDLNATQAAIRAGYSKTSAAAIGYETLQKPYVANAISDAMAKRSARTLVSQDRVVKELARIAFADMRDFVTWGPDGVELRPSDDLCKDDSAAVFEVSQKAGKEGPDSISIKLRDKLKALELLGRHQAMFTDNHNVNLSAQDEWVLDNADDILDSGESDDSESDRSSDTGEVEDRLHFLR